MVAGMRKVFDSGKTKDLSWRKQQLEQLHKMYAENHEAITAAVRADLGGSKLRGIGEVSVAANADHALANIDSWCREKWVAGWIHRQCIRPEPKGLVLIISPWNFPFQLSLGPLVPAIAAGNLVVIKPSELNLNSSPLIASLVKKYMDPECIKVVEGEVPETTALLNQRWDHIFYTGNGAVGRIVMTAAAKHLTPVTLELGGKSPAIIDETALVDVACERLAAIKWMNCGQICVAPDYVLVHRSKEEEFLQKSAAIVKKSFGDDPKASVDYGTIINERHVDRLSKLIETSGGTVVCGGAQGVDKSARYVPPTIIKQPKIDAPVMKEEIFGPVLPVIPYDDLETALRMIKEKETPLAFYVYSQSNRNIERALTSISSGGSCVNTSLEHLLSEDLPFGGKGESGMGSYHGKFGFDELSHTRAVLRKSTLPGFRGPFVPLPDAGKPLPDFVYSIAVKMQLGFVPRGVKAAWRSFAGFFGRVFRI
eukprot:TRINITY_DN44076_c0_g1_i1.p1 TRINITY_DN44076_c0_g1~~TRINITY_DN44076_c0_g1_i1.p1  ORF type:complete len:517 (+),score=92.42 TRINITY_DN44076_c0_g1_i1:109-1551(+)